MVQSIKKQFKPNTTELLGVNILLKVLKGITRLQAVIKARLLSVKFKRMREEKQIAEQERLRRLERERQQRENEAKIKKVGDLK